MSAAAQSSSGAAKSERGRFDSSPPLRTYTLTGPPLDATWTTRHRVSRDNGSARPLSLFVFADYRLKPPCFESEDGVSRLRIFDQPAVLESDAPMAVSLRLERFLCLDLDEKWHARQAAIGGPPRCGLCRHRLGPAGCDPRSIKMAFRPRRAKAAEGAVFKKSSLNSLVIFSSFRVARSKSTGSIKSIGTTAKSAIRHFRH